MLTTDDLDQAAADLEAELPDVATVYRQDGETTDPDTFQPIPAWTVVAQSVACLVVREPQNQQSTTSADAPTALRRYLVTLPLTVDDARVGDVVVVEECHDPATVASALTVSDPQYGSLSISRRVRCQANQTYPRGLPEVTP